MVVILNQFHAVRNHHWIFGGIHDFLVVYFSRRSKKLIQTTDLRGGGAASCIVFVEIKNDILLYYFNLGSYDFLDDSDQILKFMLDDVNEYKKKSRQYFFHLSIHSGK